MINDTLGDRMKSYESMSGSTIRTMPLLPTLARLDGVAFHSFTKGLQRPYDERLSNLMVETTKFLVEETNARCGYTQSDEISLLWYSDRSDSQIYRNGRLFKIISVLASTASVYFNKRLPEFLPEKVGASPVFDNRVWTVPTKHEATNAFMWRETDAVRNSVTMAAQHYFSHNELMFKHAGEMQEMLFTKHSINWNNYPSFFKRGSYIQRRPVEKAFSTEEIDRLPPMHAARTNHDLKILRSVVDRIELPPLVRIANRVDVIFDGAAPISEAVNAA